MMSFRQSSSSKPFMTMSNEGAMELLMARGFSTRQCSEFLENGGEIRVTDLRVRVGIAKSLLSDIARSIAANFAQLAAAVAGMPSEDSVEVSSGMRYGKYTSMR